MIAVGFDRTGQPTWTRLLDHFRAMQIYGGAASSSTRQLADTIGWESAGFVEGGTAPRASTDITQPSMPMLPTTALILYGDA